MVKMGVLEKTLGDGKKKIEHNEKQSVIVKEEAWLNKNVKKGNFKR